MTTQFFIPMRPPTTTHNAKELHAYMKGGKPRTVKSRLKEDGRFWIDGEKVGRKEPGSRG